MVSGVSLVEGGEAGGHGDGVGAEGAALEEAGGALRVVEEVHEVGAATEGAHREAADDFAEAGQVGGDAVDFLQTADVGAEGDDFVEDQ